MQHLKAPQATPETLNRTVRADVILQKSGVQANDQPRPASV